MFTTSITVPSILSTSLSSGTINGTNSTITNAVHTTLSSANAIFTTSITVPSILASTSLSSGALYSTNATSTNIVATNFSSSNIRVTNGITTGSIFASSLLNTAFTPVHNIINTGSIANASPLGIYAPNATRGSTIATFFGQTIGNGNVGQLNFQYYTNNNTQNSIGLSFYGGGGSSMTLLNNGQINLNSVISTGTVNTTSLNTASLSGSYNDTLFQYALRYESAGLETMGVEIDSVNNVYIHGLYQTQGTFYATNGSSVVVTGTGTAGTAFISKYDNTGAFQYNLRIDGDAYDRLKKITTDSSNYLYVCGYGAAGSGTTKFYATNGSTVVATMGNLGSHVSWFAEYDPNGTLLMTLKADGVNSDIFNTLAINRTITTSDIYLAGYTTSTQCNFYATNGSTIVGTIGAFNASSQTGMIARYDTNGTFKYAIRMGTVGSNTLINNIALDPSGYLYAAGWSSGVVGVYNTNGTLAATIGNAGSIDGFVVAFDSNGNYTNYIRVGGVGNEYVNTVTTDAYGYLYFGGYTTSTQANIYDSTGSIVTSFTSANTNNCGFAVSYLSNFSYYSHHTIDGTGSEEVSDITISSDGYAYVSGRSTSSVTQFYSGNSGNVFQTIGNTLGASWVYNYNNLTSPLYVDGSSAINSQFAKLDSNNNIYAYSELNAGTSGNIMDNSNQNIVSQIKAATSTNQVGYLIKYNKNNPTLQQLCASSVGVGTTNPTASLDVRGRIVTNNMLVSGGNLGVGMSALSYSLQLNADSAAKPGTNTWTIASDERLKTNIELANLDMCYNNIKSLPLKKYTWRDDIYTRDQVPDRSKLGWIAQDVELVFPKAVEITDMYGYNDCRTLNSDQIIASLYGAVQKMINMIETNNLSTNYNSIDIKHPIDTNKRLVHSFIEGPRCDLIYRGTVKLVNGQANVNIDTDCVEEQNCRMTEGTFEALCRNPVKYLHNNDSFSRIRGILHKNILTIICEDTNSTDSIDWMIVAERKDSSIRDWNRTNENGYLQTEYQV